MSSPGFSSFRSLMDRWDQYLEMESMENNVRNMIDGQGLILFFRKGDGVFGAPEEGRVVFAKMKNPDDDMPEGWIDDANFAAFDLFKAMAGEKIQNMFSHKDLDDIEIIDPEELEAALASGCSEKKKPAAKQVKHGKHGAGMLKLRDRSK